MLIYSGPGVGPRSIREASVSLGELLGGFALRHIGPEELVSGSWQKAATLLVMPGGRDLPYWEVLGGAGCRRIRAYVENGGRYLGFCAGAYFACAQVEFELGTPHEVRGPRELRFYNGIARGSTLRRSAYSYCSSLDAQSTRLISSRGVSLQVHFEGGCTFEGDEDATPLAFYEQLPGQPVAAVSCRVGHGRAVLSGPHPEFAAATNLPERPDLATELLPFESARRNLLREYLDALFLESE